jgi:hypothetical protein
VPTHSKNPTTPVMPCLVRLARRGRSRRRGAGPPRHLRRQEVAPVARHPPQASAESSRCSRPCSSPRPRAPGGGQWPGSTFPLGVATRPPQAARFLASMAGPREEHWLRTPPLAAPSVAGLGAVAVSVRRTRGGEVPGARSSGGRRTGAGALGPALPNRPERTVSGTVLPYGWDGWTVRNRLEPSRTVQVVDSSHSSNRTHAEPSTGVGDGSPGTK